MVKNRNSISHSPKELKTMTTPNSLKKGSVKRPVPSDSESEDRDQEKSLTDMLKGGFPKNKKGKFMLQPEANSGPSDYDDDDDTEEEDSDEEHDNEDEEDSEENEDDDDEVDSDEDEPENAPPTKQIPIVKSPKTKSDTSINTTNQLSTPKLENNISNDNQYLMVPYPPKDLSKLKTVLESAGYAVASVQSVHFPLALAAVSENKKSKNCNLQKSLSCDGNTVHTISLNGSKEALDQINRSYSTKSLFVTGIPKSCTLELLCSKIPAHCKPINSKLLDRGHKNRYFNAAFLDFTDTKAASASFDVLSQLKIENQALRVAYSRERIDALSKDNLRGSTKCLLASQLPPTVTDAQLKAVFTTALKVKIVSRVGETLCYLTFADETAATEAFDAHNNSHMGSSKLILRFVPSRDMDEAKFQAHVSNIPPDATDEQILALFPGATKVFKSGKWTYAVQFASEDVLRKSVVGKKTINNTTVSVSIDGGLGHNIATVKNLPFSATEDDVLTIFPLVSNIELEVGVNGKPNGTATVEFPSAIQCEEAMKKRPTLMGRTIHTQLKRVNVTCPETKTTNNGKKSPANILSNSTKTTDVKASSLKAPKVGQKHKTEKLPASKVEVPPQVGSEESEESGSESEATDEDSEPEQPKSKKTKVANSRMELDGEDVDEDDDDDEDEDEDEEDDNDDDEDDEDDDEDDVEGSEDEGIDDESEDETPASKGKNKEQRPMGKQNNFGFQRGRGSGFDEKSRGGYGQDRGRGQQFRRGGGGQGQQFGRGGGGGGGRGQQFGRGGGRGFKRGDGNRGGRGRGGFGNRGGFNFRGGPKN